MNTKKLKCTWLSRLSANRFSRAGVIIALVAIAILIFMFPQIWQIYVPLSLLFVLIISIYKVLFKRKQKEHTAQEVKTENDTDLESTIASLESEKKQLQARINELTRTNEEYYKEIKLLKQQFEDTGVGRFVEVFIFIQHINNWMKRLPDSVKSYKEVTNEEISRILSSYGFVFADLTPETLYCYDYERGPTDSPEVPRKAIVTKKGRVVVKGKAFIPEDYGIE